MATTSASTVLAWVAVSSPPVSMLHERGEVLGRQRLGALDGEVVLDVGEHPVGVGAGGDGGGGQAVEVALDGDHDGVVGRLAPGGGRERAPAIGGQRRERRVDAGDVVGARVERHEVGLGEVAVVVGVLLHAEGAGAARGLVPVAGLLAHALTALEEVDLAERLVVDGPAERAQRVEVLDLAAGAPRAHRRG